MKLYVRDIQQAVCEHFGIARAELLSAARRREIARPRQICCYLAWEITPRNYSAIGRSMRRDHSTVIYAVRTIRRQLLERSGAYSDVNHIRRRIVRGVDNEANSCERNRGNDPLIYPRECFSDALEQCQSAGA